MIDLAAVPPKEAIDYFQQNGFAIGFDYRDVWQSEHQASFTVAKVMQQDILEDIRKAVGAALVSGIPYEQFAKTLTPSLQAKGWWGRKEMTDPQTGEVKEVQLGSPRRLKLIYDTNLRTSHSEGQWQRIQDNKEAFPYLEYDANNSAHPRHEHSAWDGLILPVDHPFWLAHFPVKAYRCHCRTTPKTQRQVNRSGKPVDEAPDVPMVPYVNQRTGEVQQIPVGVDPSFHYPPGGRRAGLSQHLVEELESAPPEMTRASVTDLVSGPAFSTWYQKPAGSFALAHLEQTSATVRAAKTQLVLFTEQTLARQLREHPEITLEDYALVQRVMDEGVVIPEPGQSAGVRRYALDGPDGQVMTVTVIQDDNGVFMTDMQRLSREQLQADKHLGKMLSPKK